MTEFIYNIEDYDNRIKEFFLNPNQKYVYLGNSEPILHIACRIGNLEHIKTLLSNGASKNAETYWGNCLHVALSSGNSEVAKYLIENGVDYNTEDVQGFTALFHASTNGMEEIVDILLDKKVKVNTEGGHGRTPLNRAIEYDHTSIAKKLINYGAYIDGDNATYGRVPLTICVVKNNEEIFKMLIEKGANKYIRDYKGKGSTAYELIIKFERNQLLKYLLTA